MRYEPASATSSILNLTLYTDSRSLSHMYHIHYFMEITKHGKKYYSISYLQDMNMYYKYYDISVGITYTYNKRVHF